MSQIRTMHPVPVMDRVRSIQHTPAHQAYARQVSAHQSYAPQQPAGAVRLRITRRGRVVLAALITLAVGALLFAAAVLTADRAQASAEAGTTEFSYLVVEPGQTLWGLAAELDPNSDPREVIDEVVRLNQLQSSELRTGDRIAIPTRYADTVVPDSSAGLAVSAAALDVSAADAPSVG